jgi:gallidermin/nisin family lantibiotic
MPVAANGQVENLAKNDREDERDPFDLDVQVSKGGSGVDPQITSKFLCTPGCGNTGSFNSFCC